jgi:hypothetical protein
VSGTPNSCTNQCTKRARTEWTWWKMWNAESRQMPQDTSFLKLSASVRDVECADSRSCGKLGNSPRSQAHSLTIGPYIVQRCSCIDSELVGRTRATKVTKPCKKMFIGVAGARNGGMPRKALCLVDVVAPRHQLGFGPRVLLDDPSAAGSFSHSFV